MPANDLRESHVGEGRPSWADQLQRAVIKMQLRQRIQQKALSELLREVRSYRVENAERREADLRKQQSQQTVIRFLKNLPLVLGVLSIMFPHLKPLFDAIVKGLGAP